ncbi:MAG: winged helix-turn-helix transcriptional regulator [Granulosicoccus sp.]
MVNDEFIQLCSRAWALRILSYLGQGRDARITPLAYEFSTGRTAITSSMGYLIELGYVKRTKGHGHPLRPAFELTKKGQNVAEWAMELDEILAPESWSIAARTWSLPVMRLTSSAPRFGKLRSELKPVTDRALSQTLKILVTQKWVTRAVNVDAAPPEVSYLPCGIGEILIPCLENSFSL